MVRTLDLHVDDDAALTIFLLIQTRNKPQATLKVLPPLLERIVVSKNIRPRPQVTKPTGIAALGGATQPLNFAGLNLAQPNINTAALTGIAQLLAGLQLGAMFPQMTVGAAPAAAPPTAVAGSAPLVVAAPFAPRLGTPFAPVGPAGVASPTAPANDSFDPPEQFPETRVFLTKLDQDPRFKSEISILGNMLMC